MFQGRVAQGSLSLVLFGMRCVLKRKEKEKKNLVAVTVCLESCCTYMLLLGASDVWTKMYQMNLERYVLRSLEILRDVLPHLLLMFDWNLYQVKSVLNKILYIHYFYSDLSIT